ncbi:MAG: phage shock protein, partial [Sphingomonadales bacterium]|nr:phage shock protein [Sphingomonadales bacterium]
MPELEILEAKVPVRTPRLIEVEAEPTGGRFAPVAGWLSGPVFSRARDIFAANMTELLDRAEDPARMIRMIILEMEETLVDVRATAARSIADIKEMRRTVGRLDELQSNWTAKAELALSKGRDDLAKAALVERQKADEMATSLRDELNQIEQVLRGYEADIAKLQAKLREARARQNAIAARFESAVTRAKAREIMHGSRTADAFAKFELLERRADFAEGRCEALGISSLEDEIDQLKAGEKIEAELEAM